jgi:hypothetical protein
MAQGPLFYLILVGKHEEKRPLSKTNCRRKDTVKIYFNERGHEGGNWIHIAQYKVQWRKLCEHSNELLVSTKDAEVFTYMDGR